MRAMRDFMDYTMNTIPGWSSTLPPGGNSVTGDTINYNLIPSNANDPVLDELNRMAEGIYGPPAKKLTWRRAFHGTVFPAQRAARHDDHRRQNAA